MWLLRADTRMIRMKSLTWINTSMLKLLESIALFVEGRNVYICLRHSGKTK